MLRWRFWLWATALAACGSPAPAAIGDALSEDALDVAAVVTADAACAPHLAVDPPALTFPYLPAGSETLGVVTLRNQGDCPLVCSAFTFTASAPVFAVVLGAMTEFLPAAGPVTLAPPLTVPAGSVLDVQVTAKATDAKLQTATLTLFCDDPSQPNGTPVAIQLNSAPSCLQLVPSDVVFGGTTVGTQSNQTVQLMNPTGASQCVTAIARAGATTATFSLDFKQLQSACPQLDPAVGPTSAQPCCLSAGAKAALTVRYAPTIASAAGKDDTATLQVTVADAACPPAVGSVAGFTVPGPACPVAVITVAEGDEVVPQSTLHLKGDASTGANGAAIKSYTWTAKQPAGSAKGFVPSSTFPNPTFTPDAAGEYEFCLDVVDANGVKSCQQTCQKVLVVPNNAVHIELLWDTPADPDQTDTGPAAGADLDLHFANYLATGVDLDCDGTGDPWFNDPFDCFWYNPMPQWGSANTAIKDDPTMDLDDTDGAGPENLNLEHPEGDPSLPRWYDIGVHYWNDHGYGVSYATITVYLFGAVALKIDKISMNPLDMWNVGKLNWPNQLTGTSMPPLTVCYQTPGSKPGDVCAGTAKMWQPKGEWCITPCYANPKFVKSVGGGAIPAGCP